MADLDDFFYTDDVDDVEADHINNLLAATLRAEYRNTETITATRALVDADTPLQVLTPDGDDRELTFPAASDDNHVFFIVNASNTYDLILPAGFAPIRPGRNALLIPTWHVILDTETVQVDTTLTGDGSAGDPLGVAGYPYRQTLYITSTTNFQKANYPWLKMIVSEIQGGGGGGGGSATNEGAGGGGGGGGYSRKMILASALSASETVTIGAAGTGGAAGNNAGTAGGATSFGAHHSANGGGGGQAASGSVVDNNGGTASGGDLNLTGGHGARRRGSAEATSTGAGGNSRFGFGGVAIGTKVNTEGLPGNGFGAGGSGGYRLAADREGGNGVAGIAIIHLYG